MLSKFANFTALVRWLCYLRCIWPPLLVIMQRWKSDLHVHLFVFQQCLFISDPVPLLVSKVCSVSFLKVCGTYLRPCCHELRVLPVCARHQCSWHSDVKADFFLGDKLQLWAHAHFFLSAFLNKSSTFIEGMEYLHGFSISFVTWV